MKHARRLQLAALLAGMALACWAQTPEPVLKGKDVTEAALVDALSVEGPSAQRFTSSELHEPAYQWREAVRFYGEGAFEKHAKPAFGKPLPGEPSEVSLR